MKPLHHRALLARKRWKRSCVTWHKVALPPKPLFEGWSNEEIKQAVADGLWGTAYQSLCHM